MVDSKEAETLLRKILSPYNNPIDYIASYRTSSGRELALERQRTEGFYVWVQKYTTKINGITIQNREYPGLPYEASQTREANLNEKNAPKLMFGKKAWYLKADNIEALENLIDWYKTL
jgi:hypothetical protein